MDPAQPLPLAGDFATWAVALALAVARVGGLAFVFPPLTRLGVEGGALRGAIALILAVPLYPLALDAALGIAPGAWGLTLLLVAKEAVLGIVLGLLYGVPFWAASTAGDVIDMQRGASAGDIVDPASAEDTTPSGTLLLLFAITLFYASGLFRVVLDGVYASLTLWPAGQLLPPVTPAALDTLLEVLRAIAAAGLLLAAPLIVAMMLLEGMLAVLNRVVPQLDEFFFALAAKTLLSILLLPLYFFLLARHLGGMQLDLSGIVERLRVLAPP